MQEKKAQKREKNRKLCGRVTKQLADGLGMLQYVTFYCRQKGCPTCGPIKLASRQKAVTKMLRDTDQFYSISIEEPSVKGFTNKIRGKNYLTMPQADGTVLFLLDEYAEFKFSEASPLERHNALGLATAEENIFTHKRRSTGGEWRLTESTGEGSAEIDQIEFYRLIPYMDPPNDDGKRLYLLNQMRASANIWTKGILDPTDQKMVQEFVDHVSSAFIEMALREGFRFNYEMSYIQKECQPISRIARWIGASIDGSVKFFTIESKKALGEISPQLLPILTGHAGIKNWREEFVSKGKSERLINDAISLYNSSEEVFLVFYTEDQMEAINKYVSGSSSKERLIQSLTNW